MFKVLKKWWKYFTAKTNRSFERNADPAVQLEQAISESQQQHRRLKEQAANVIASQKTAEIRLNGKMTGRMSAWGQKLTSGAESNWSA